MIESPSYKLARITFIEIIRSRTNLVVTERSGSRSVIATRTAIFK